MRRVESFAALAWMLIAAGSAVAETLYKDIQPGKSTREEVARTLGQPVRQISATEWEYRPQLGTGKIVVEFRAQDAVVDRLDLHFRDATIRAAVLDALQLPPEPTATGRSAGGTLVEYFGDRILMSLTYATGDLQGGVTIVGYYSRVRFDRAVGDLRAGQPAPGGSGTATAGIPQPRLDLGSQLEQPRAGGCPDVYYWAQAEHDVAKRSRDAARRLAILAVLIAAQKGDCARAREQADGYKRSFR
jgi:hypothetical protein